MATSPRPDDALTRGLPDDVADDLLAQGVPRTLARDEVVFSEDDAGSSTFIVSSGKVKLMRAGITGQPGLYLVLGAGEVFGNLNPTARRSGGAPQWP
jgi:CRP-like cAMP-binding protein